MVWWWRECWGDMIIMLKGMQGHFCHFGSGKYAEICGVCCVFCRIQQLILRSGSTWKWSWWKEPCLIFPMPEKQFLLWGEQILIEKRFGCGNRQQLPSTPCISRIWDDGDGGGGSGGDIVTRTAWCLSCWPFTKPASVILHSPHHQVGRGRRDVIVAARLVGG